MKHGLYASVADAELQRLMAQVQEEVDLLEEIRFAKAKLARAIAWAKENPERVQSHPRAFEAAVSDALRDIRQLVETQARVESQRNGGRPAIDVHLIWDQVQEEVEDEMEQLNQIGVQLENVQSLEDLKRDP